MIKASQTRSPSMESHKFEIDERFKTPKPKSPGPKYKRTDSSPRLAKTLGSRKWRPKSSCLINYPSTPRSVGPGKYGIDKYPVVREEPPKKSTFSKSQRFAPIRQTSELSDCYQSSRIDSRHPSKYGVTMGRSTRDQSANTGMFYSTMASSRPSSMTSSRPSSPTFIHHCV